LVTEAFERRSLKLAFKKISDTYSYNVILDPRLEGEGELSVTMSLLNVLIDVAIELIAETNGLEVVRRANVFFVTSDENAYKMRLPAGMRNGFPVPSKKDVAPGK